MRQFAHEDLEEVLFVWFSQTRTINIPISGPTLKMKAKELTPKLGHCGFSCSTGWLERFKSKHGIVFKKI